MSTVPIVPHRKSKVVQVAAHEIVKVTPELAEKWLGKNTKNRNVRISKVMQYGRDMANDAWQFNGDPIRFDVNGVLLDGQHRLRAIMQSGVTIPMLVVYNLPPETQDTMDIGAGRKMGDQLSLAGETNANVLASVLRRVLAYKNGVRTTSGGGYGNPTFAEMRSFLEENPTVRRAADVANLARRYVNAAPSVIGMTYFLCAEKDREAADVFFVQQLIEAIGLTEKDPARILAKRLSEMSERRGETNSDDVVRYILQAWNAFRSSKQLSKLQAPKGGWTATNFPEPI